MTDWQIDCALLAALLAVVLALTVLKIAATLLVLAWLAWRVKW